MEVTSDQNGRGHAHNPTRPSSTPVSAMRALDLHESEKENIQPKCPNTGFREYVRPQVTTPTNLTTPTTENGNSGAMGHSTLMPLPPEDFDGNHSSEEELEEINKCDGDEPELVTPLSSSSPSQATPNSVNSSIPSSRETPESHWSMASNSPSSDEAMPSDHAPSNNAIGSNGRGHLNPTPVQFSTSPPTGLHVYKPRRSSSPPTKMFLASGSLALAEGGGDGGSHLAPPTSGYVEQHQAGGVALEREGSTEFERRDRGGTSSSRRMISPRKKYRHSRTNHMQRPCLDFEKMQQV